jgi:competence protein ComEA
MVKLFKYLLLCISLVSLMTGIAQAQAQKQAKDEPKSTSTAPSSTGTAKSKPATVIDINTASEKELANLPKIGDVRAKAIVKGRPYKGKDELVEKKILTEDVYSGIKDQIIARQKSAVTDKNKK